MQDSEALLLGATILKPLRGIFHNSEKDKGCALGMIYAARGFSGVCTPDWMYVGRADLPCPCKELPGNALIMGSGGLPVSKNRFYLVKDIVIHVFNQHVCDGSWTIERLADWLRTVEPEPIEAQADVKREEPAPVAA